MAKFVIRQLPTGVKFDLRAGNGQTIAASEVYTTEAACRSGVESLRLNAPEAPVEDQTQPGYEILKHPKFELYRDRAGQFRFRLKARNGEIIAVSEGYCAKSGCRKGIESLRRNAPGAKLIAPES